MSQITAVYSFVDLRVIENMQIKFKVGHICSGYILSGINKINAVFFQDLKLLYSICDRMALVHQLQTQTGCGYKSLTKSAQVLYEN